MTILILMVTFKNEREPMATFQPWQTTDDDTYLATLDYAEGLTPPRYPMPATYRDCIVNHNQWLALQFIHQHYR